MTDALDTLVIAAASYDHLDEAVLDCYPPSGSVSAR